METTEYIEFLEPGETEVELLVRNIDPNSQEPLTELEKCIRQEISDATKIPFKSHITSQPELEVGSAKEVLDSLSKAVDHNKAPISLDIAKLVYYRALHWQGRLQRLKNSFGDLAGAISVTTKARRVSLIAKGVLDKLLNPPQSVIVREKPSEKLAPESTQKNISNVGRPALISDQWSNVPLNLPSNAEPYNPTFDPWRAPGAAFPPQPQPFFQPHVNNLVELPTNNRLNNPSPAKQLIDTPREGMANYRPYHPKWKLSFDGNNRGLDVHDFVFRLETFAKRDNYPMHKLPFVIHSFITDTAEKWLWVFIRDNPDCSWNALREALLSRFSSHESERETRRFIERRTQKLRESFNDFSLEIQTYNGRLANRFSEMELLEIIMENMNPALQSATLAMEFNSIESLRTVCQKYERIWANSGFDQRAQGEYHNRRQAVHEISTEVDHLDKSMKSLQTVEATVNEGVSAINRPQQNTSSSNFLICWNCRDLGHRYHDCVKDFVTFCFGCGKAGVKKPNCPVCLQKGSVNSSPNVVQAGVTHSEVTPNTPRTSKQ